jgi:glucose-1-phosphate adenylyltransferase
MKLLSPDVRNELLNTPEKMVYTKLRNSAPTLYKDGSSVKNSLIADGCSIEGVVENSIIFRGVKVRKGAVVKNSILLQDTSVGVGTSLNCVITDKNVEIRDRRNLSGHGSMPFFLSKGSKI